MNDKIEQLKSKIQKTKSLSCLICYIHKYNTQTEGESYGADLYEWASILKNRKLPLPSGRVGNPLALALELNDYISAKFLIDNAIKMELSTNTIASDVEGKDFMNLEQVYLYSLTTFDRELVSKDKIPDDKLYEMMVNEIKNNEEASKYIKNYIEQRKNK